MKIYTNEMGHMTKMTAMHVGKTFRPNGLMALELGM